MEKKNFRNYAFEYKETVLWIKIISKFMNYSLILSDNGA